jgi:hypothetical protein
MMVFGIGAVVGLASSLFAYLRRTVSIELPRHFPDAQSCIAGTRDAGSRARNKFFILRACPRNRYDAFWEGALPMREGRNCKWVSLTIC